jgi:hypothetical protein
MQGVAPTVLLDHVKIDPTLSSDEFAASDVVHVPFAILAVLLTVVVQANHGLVVSHVDESLIASVTDSDLRSRSRQPVVDEEKAQASLLWRLGTGVH